MDQTGQLDQFEAQRGRMFSIAYHMLGSVGDAEDIVQEAYLRYRGASPDSSPDSIRSPQAFLSTVVTRLCLNQLQSARARRETYLGPWLPEPLITVEDDMAERADLHESISMAFLALLERLTPVERAVFLLREVFEYTYEEIAAILGKEEAACRQILSRAKRFIAARRPRFTPSGDLDALVQMLSDDVSLWADGGGRVRGAATRPLHGPRAVARFLLGSVRFVQGPYEPEFTSVNGEPAVILRVGGAPIAVVCFTLSGDKIAELRVVGNPDKLRHIPSA